MQQVPTRAQLSRYVVNRPGWEVVRQSLYDFQTYPTAGASTLTFFALPVGQSGKTLSDTNMTLASQLPANQEFLLQSIEVLFHPTSPNGTDQDPAEFGAQTTANLVNDVYRVGRSGNLTLIVGSKPYLQEAPIGRFPAKTYLEVMAALSDATTAGADRQSRIAFANWRGRPYLLDPAPLLLTQNQNFTVSLNWPEGPVSVTYPGRIGVVLDGLLYRRSQ